MRPSTSTLSTGIAVLELLQESDLKVKRIDLKFLVKSKLHFHRLTAGNCIAARWASRAPIKPQSGYALYAVFLRHILSVAGITS